MTSPALRAYSAPDERRLAATLGDPDRSPIALTCRAAMLLLAALEVGQNVDRLAARTGSSRSFVARCARRLLDNGVWLDGRTACEWGEDGPAHPSFWNDVAVAEGRLCRRTDDAGAFEWAAAGEWIKYYEYQGAGEQLGTGYVPHPRAFAPAPSEWGIGAEPAGEVEDEAVDPVTPAAPASPPRRRASGEPATRPQPKREKRPHDAVSTKPPADRPRPRKPSEDPVGKLFPDAVWIQ